MNLTTNSRWKMKLMALAFALLASLTVARFGGFGAKAAQITRSLSTRMAGRMAGAKAVTTTHTTTASMFANYVVTNLNDNGAGSLRQAILNANGNAGADTITFQAGLTGVITLTTGELVISDSVTITGPGANLLTVSGNNASRVFFINPGAANATAPPNPPFPAIQFSGLRIANGVARGGNGGGQSAGYGAKGGGGAGIGGGIFINGGTVTIDGVAFSSNQAIGGNGASANGGGTGHGSGGGGAFTSGVSINANNANGTNGGSGGALGGAGGSGGASPSDGSGGGEGGGGGGGGSDDLLGGGSGGGDGGAGGFGGGGGGGGVGLIPDNIGGKGGNGGFGGGGGGGGGVFQGGPPGSGGPGGAFGGKGGDGIIANATNNSAAGGGGGGLGGAIFVRLGSLTLTRSAFSNNQAARGNGGLGFIAASNGANGQGKGGAIFINAGATANACGTTFSANSATDAAGSGTDTNDVYGALGAINDVTKPVIACNLVPAQTANADANCSAVVPDVRALVRAQSSDGCTANGSLTVTQSPAQGSVVSGAGSHPITVTVTDASNNSETCVVGFTVIDNTKPVIACNLVPAQTANADANCQAVVPDVRALVMAQSSDGCTANGSLTVTQNPTQGATVSGAGSHPITVTVTDAANNSQTCVVAFTVNDVTKPAITCPADIAAGTGGSSAVVTYAAPSVSDNCSGVGSPVCSPASGSAFPLGVTTVNCSVKDAAQNSNSCAFKVTVNKVSASFSDPLACTGPGNVVKGAIQLTNNGNVATNAVMTTALPAGLLALPGTCTASVGTCSALNASTITYTSAIPAGQTVTITYQAQVGDQVVTGSQLCANTTVSFNGGTTVSAPACVTATCPAVGPGGALDAKSPVSDQKSGSVLIYNLYSSSAFSPNTQNTRINLTNIHPVLPARIHLFFVDGSNCSVADSYVCMTPNQTTSFLASDFDPGATGYIVAVAVDAHGCPTNFNYLIGDEYVKFSSGHAANLGAEAFSALAGGLPPCDDSSTTAELRFDGVSYNQAPRVLALSNIPSKADGADTMLVLNRIGGNLATGAAALTDIVGVFYDDTETGLSFSFNPRACQFRSSVNNNFPRITPRFETFVPTGRSGWLKLYSTSDQAILGAAINFNQNAEGSPRAFNQGHNLHKLTLTSGAVYTIPVFPPGC